MLYLDNTTRPWKEKYNSSECLACRTLIKESFKDLIFEEGPHTYTLDGVKVPSVSSMVEKFIEPFDSVGQSIRCSERYFDDESSPYYRKTAEEIQKMWKDNAKNATDKGTEAHAFGESCMYYMVGEYDKILPEYKDRLLEDGRFYSHGGFEDAIVRFWEDVPDSYIPILAETSVYCRAWEGTPLYAGTFDLMFYTELNGTPGLVQFDYKTNADLYKNFAGKRMIRGLDNLLDTPKNHYEVQQELYSVAIRNKTHLKIFGKRLIWVKESGEYQLVKMTEPVTETIIREIEHDAKVADIDF